MSEDLETLLRDAGRAPTIDLDVAGVHAAGRRRATTRRVATGLGALVVLGAVAVGVASLSEDLVQVPDITNSPSPTVGETEASADAVPAFGIDDIATMLGVRVVHQSDGSGEAAAGMAVGYPGQQDSFIVHEHELGDGIADLRVTDGEVALWEEDGQVVAAPLSHLDARQPVATPVAGLRWDLLGRWDAEHFLARRHAQDDTSGAGELFVVGPVPAAGVGNGAMEMGVTPLDETLATQLRAAYDTAGERPQIVDAHALGDGLVVLSRMEESTSITRFGADGSVSTLLEVSAFERAIEAVVVAGDEVWALETGDDDRADLLVAAGDGGAARIATPAGRGPLRAADAIVAATGPGGPRVVISGTRASGEAYLLHVDVPGVRALAATAAGDIAAEAAPDEELDRELFSDLGTIAPVVLLDEPADAATSACAGDTDRLNQPAAGEIGVWLSCWDAPLPEDGSGYEQWWRADRFQGADLAGGPDGMRAILQAWLDGPTDEEAARGVTGPDATGAVTIGDITVDGNLVTVELDAPGEAGTVIPTGVGDGSAWRGAAAAALLQLPDVDGVILVTDGVCGFWEGGADPDLCITWTDADMPWGRGANSACVRDSDAINAAPSAGSGNLWFTCGGAEGSLPDGVGFAWTRIDDPWPGASLPSDPAARTRLFVETFAAGPTVAQQAAGLFGGLDDGITLAAVSFEGSRVLVDLAVATAGVGEFERVPSWSTSYQSRFWAMGFANVALQLPEYDELQFTTNGRCEEFTLMSEVEPCTVYTEADTAWNQGS